MANNIEQTNKQLAELENKLLSLRTALNSISGLTGMDSTFLPAVTQTIQQVAALSNQVEALKNTMAGIGSAGESLNVVNSRVAEIARSFDNATMAANAFAGSANIPIPTTLRADEQVNAAQRAAEAQRVAQQQVVEAQQRAAEQMAEAQRRAAAEAQRVADQNRNIMLGAIKMINTVAQAVNTAVNRIIGILRTAANIIGKIIGVISNTILSITRGVRGLIELFGNLGNRLRETFTGVSSGKEVTGIFNNIGASATELRSKILLLKGAFDGLFNSEMIRKAKELMASVYSLQNIAGTGITQQVLDWAQSMEYAFGLSARDLIADMNELTGVLYGLGMTGPDVAIGSENILLMSRYLAFMGAAGGDADQVTRKLVSGMKGMTAAIDDLGLSVRDAQMDQFLETLRAQGGEFSKIATDFSSLNEEARVYVRYASLIEQFTKNYDITNFADALNTVTGRISILSQTWNTLITTIGTGLNKLLAKAASVLIPIINWVQQLITRLFALIGIDVTLNVGINEGLSDNFDNIGSGLDETKEKLDEVEKSANKARGSLQGFDRVNNVTTPSSGSSGAGSAGAGGFDYSKLMTSMLDDLNKMALDAQQSFVDAMTDKLKENLNTLREVFNQFAKDITGRTDFDLGFDWSRIKENLLEVLQNIGYIIKSWGIFVIEIGLKIADDLNVGLIITELTELMRAVSNLAVAITDALIPAFRNFYDIALSPIVEFIGNVVIGAIRELTDELDRWAGWFRSNQDLIINFFTALANVVNSVWQVIEPYLNSLADTLGTAFRGIGERIRDSLQAGMEGFNANEIGIIAWIKTELPNIIDTAIRKVKEFTSVLTGVGSLDALVEMNSGSGWGNFLSIISSLREITLGLVPIIQDLAKAFGEWASNELIPYLVEKLQQLGDWVNTHKDAITDLLKTIGGMVWSGFKVFVDLVGKLVNFAVENPGAIVGMFTGLTALKIGSWFTGTAAGIAETVLQLKALKSLGSISAMMSGAGGAAGAAGAAGAGAAGAGAAGAGTAAGAAGAGAAAGAALGPILAVVAAIAALIAIVADLWDISEKFREVFTTIGKDLAESWNGFLDTFRKTDEAGNTTVPLLDKLKAAFDKVALALEPIITLVGVLAGGLLDGILTMLGPIVDFLGTTLADALTLVAGLLDIVIGVLTLDGDKILQGLENVGASLLDWVLSIPGLIGGVIDGIITAVVDIVENLGIAFVDGFEGGIKSAWSGFTSWLSGLWEGLVTSIKDFFGIHSPSTLFAEIGDFLIQGLWQGIQDAWGAFISGVTGLFENLLQGIKDVFSGIGEWFSTTFNNAKEAAVNAWSNAKELFNTVKDNVASAFDSLKQNVSEKFETARTAAVSVWDGIQSTFEGIASKAADGLNTIKDKAKKIFEDVAKTGKNILGSIGEGISNGWGNIKTNASNIWDNLRTTASNALNSVANRTSAKTAATITSHARGGSVSGGQLFIANEGGSAELIGNITGSGGTDIANNGMIIEAMARAMGETIHNALVDFENQKRASGINGGNGEVNINIDGFGLIDQSTLNQLARILAPYMGATNRNVADVGFSI